MANIIADLALSCKWQQIVANTYQNAKKIYKKNRHRRSPNKWN